jgi:hypothetical protein
LHSGRGEAWPAAFGCLRMTAELTHPPARPRCRRSVLALSAPSAAPGTAPCSSPAPGLRASSGPTWSSCCGRTCGTPCCAAARGAPAATRAGPCCSSGGGRRRRRPEPGVSRREQPCAARTAHDADCSPAGTCRNLEAAVQTLARTLARTCSRAVRKAVANKCGSVVASVCKEAMQVGRAAGPAPKPASHRRSRTLNRWLPPCCRAPSPRSGARRTGCRAVGPPPKPPAACGSGMTGWTAWPGAWSSGSPSRTPSSPRSPSWSPSSPSSPSRSPSSPRSSSRRSLPGPRTRTSRRSLSLRAASLQRSPFAGAHQTASL